MYCFQSKNKMIYIELINPFVNFQNKTMDYECVH